MPNLTRIAVKGPYMRIPALGGDGRAVTAAHGPCGCGKTFCVKQHAHTEGGIVINVMANRLFNTNMYNSWLNGCSDEERSLTVNYMDMLAEGKGGKSKASERAEQAVERVFTKGKGTIFTSLESFHRIVDLGLRECADSISILCIDEATEIASKMLSATMTHPHNFRLLSEFACVAKHLVLACADWDYDAHLHRDMDIDSLGRCNVLVDYLLRSKYPERNAPVTMYVVNERHPHQQNSVKFFTKDDFPEDFRANPHVLCWLEQIERYLSAWKPGDPPIAVSCGLVDVVEQVVRLCRSLKVEFRDYTRKTDPQFLKELRDPDVYWADDEGKPKIGCVVFTQIIAWGVDLKLPANAAFMYVSRRGCTSRATAQGVERFGRAVQLRDTVIKVCVDGPRFGAPKVDFYDRARSSVIVKREGSVQHMQTLQGRAVLGARRSQCNDAVVPVIKYNEASDLELEIAAYSIAEASIKA